MLEKFKVILARSTKGEKLTLRQLRQRVWQRFETNAAHQWIIQDKELTRSFEIAIHSLPAKACLKFISEREVVFIPSTGSLACALGAQPHTDLVLIFPDLVKLLHSASYFRGISIILHELGHLYFDHSKKVMDILEAQVQADYFAHMCGFGHEIQEVLLDSPQSIDTKVRISRLTAELLTSEN